MCIVYLERNQGYENKRRMSKYLLVCYLLLLAGCTSQPKIHIFSLAVEESDISELSNLLDEAGFDARRTDLPVPPSVMRHTVIFPAIVQDFSTVELIETVLETAGFSQPRLVLESEANHYYSTDNIGVYLVNPDFEGSAASLLADPYALGDQDSNSLSFNYFSECPDGSEAQSELNLYPSGVAILEEFVWDEETNREVNILHDGEWESDSATVAVSIFGEGELHFLIKEHTGSDWYGPYEALTLVSQNSTMDIEPCDYTHLDHLDD